jgi:F-type H+-transporting ATPase subunit alpha
MVIGRGQRRLIIGDHKPAKLLLPLMPSCKRHGRLPFYVAIGQKSIVHQERGRSLLEQAGAMEYTIVVAASASESAAMRYVSAYSGFDGRNCP